jgi:phosphatidate cytidylyltransferase
VLFLLLLIWAADTAAYFIGRRWGSRKLAPTLSPGKTWVGVYGALAAAGIAALALALWLDLTAGLAAGVVVICLLTASISVVGDLYESLVKRRRGVKDSGRLLPGHGGMLDRIDSLTAAAPVFALGFLWLEARF